jgi:uncharacterized protein (DUF1697 family)
MPELRELLAGSFEDVRTYVASGNVVLSSSLSSSELARECSRLIEERFGFPVAVVVRTRDELAEVVALDPLGDVAVDPKRYQVTFLEEPLDRSVLERMQALRVAPERFVVRGRELYTWHPDGVGRSKLWASVSSDRFLGVTGTARNWNTVCTLLEMADGG